MPAVLNQKSATGPDRPWSIEFHDQPQDDGWDEFVESLPAGHHEQTSLWGQVRAQNGWEVCRILVRENGRIVAGAQMQTRLLRRLGKMAYVTYGPCLRSHDPVLQNAVIAGLQQYGREIGLQFMVVGLPYDGHYLEPGLLAAGFHHKPRKIHPHFIEATAVIDLSHQPDQLFAAMRQSKRKNILHALKKGVRVVEQNGDGLQDFYKLMQVLCQRRNTTPNPARLEFFLELWKLFNPKGWVKLFFAMHGSEPVSAALIFTFGDWVRVWKVGWSGQHGNLNPNEALWWQMILWARQNKYCFFDFVGVDPEEVKLMADGDRNGTSFRTVTSFKLGFGGQYQLLPRSFYYVFNPMWRHLIHYGAGRWLDSPTFMKAAGPLLSRFPRS